MPFPIEKCITLEKCCATLKQDGPLLKQMVTVIFQDWTLTGPDWTPLFRVGDRNFRNGANEFQMVTRQNQNVPFPIEK